MKLNTILWIVGGAVVAGVAAYGVYNLLQNKEDTPTECKNVSTDRWNCPVTSECVQDETSVQQTIVTDFEQTQQDTVASIKKHHQEAAQQLRETLNEMSRDSTDFEEKIRRVNDDLDDLLK